MKENQRKCVKCGCSPAVHPDITLHRFPKPGRTNSLRCELWAKYCFPHDAWSSPEFQNKLYSKHLMLCIKHFKTSSFIDSSGKKLVKSAAPDEECDKISLPEPLLEHMEVLEPIAGPSQERQPLSEILPCNVIQSNNPIAIKRKPPIEKNKYLLKMKYKMNKIRRLQKTIKHLKNEDLKKKNNEDVNKIYESRMSSTFALLLQGELQNFKRKVKGRRWNVDSKIIALSLYKRSPKCYKL